MSTRVRIEFQSPGFQQLLNDQATKAVVRVEAERIASAAGDGFEVEETALNFGGSPRPGYVVVAATREARQAQAEDAALERAIYSGG